jgi:hypothetical protein
MASPLVPCPGCARHVRAAETACPFCAAALPADLAARAVPAAPGRLGRAAAFLFGATVSVAACTSEITTTGGTTSGGTGGGGNATTGTGPDDDGGMSTHYGTPGFDGGAGGSPADDGGGMTLYGGPGFPDAGPDDGGPDAGDGGGPQPIYGSPPPPP